jgi:hypothetical protein
VQHTLQTECYVRLIRKPVRQHSFTCEFYVNVNSSFNHFRVYEIVQLEILVLLVKGKLVPVLN